MTEVPHLIPKAIRDLLACPKCHGPLTDAVGKVMGAPSDAPALVCSGCALAFPVEAGIPVLLIDRATPCASAV